MKRAIACVFTILTVIAYPVGLGAQEVRERFAPLLLGEVLGDTDAVFLPSADPFPYTDSREIQLGIGLNVEWIIHPLNPAIIEDIGLNLESPTNLSEVGAELVPSMTPSGKEAVYCLSDHADLRLLIVITSGRMRIAVMDEAAQITSAPDEQQVQLNKIIRRIFDHGETFLNYHLPRIELVSGLSRVSYGVDPSKLDELQTVIEEFDSLQEESAEAGIKGEFGLGSRLYFLEQMKVVTDGKAVVFSFKKIAYTSVPQDDGKQVFPPKIVPQAPVFPED